ncbi:hypothetical protein F5Y19DRAFT_445653 [Xylariaceae sp. FL1651]|nr:hypothetical protein F5Y19DRAFT_445653 [Xylariaceae sp. FL1651]
MSTKRGTNLNAKPAQATPPQTKNNSEERPFLCTHEGCERAIPGNGFPRQWNLSDHTQRAHGGNDNTNNYGSSFRAPPPSRTVRPKQPAKYKRRNSLTSESPADEEPPAPKRRRERHPRPTKSRSAQAAYAPQNLSMEADFERFLHNRVRQYPAHGYPATTRNSIRAGTRAGTRQESGVGYLAKSDPNTY